MAVLAMKRVNIYGLRSERKAILEELQRYGVIDIMDTELDDYGFDKVNTAASQALFSKSIATANSALAILKEYVPEKKSVFSVFEGRKSLSVKEYYQFVDHVDQIREAALHITLLEKSISDHKLEITRREGQIAGLRPWVSLDVPLTFSGTKKTSAFIGTFPDQITKEELLEAYQRAVNAGTVNQPQRLAIELQIVSSSVEQTCAFILCQKDVEEVVEGLLRGLGFSKPSVMTHSLPAERIARHEKKIGLARQNIAEKEQEIKRYSDQRDRIKLMADYYSMRIDKYKTLARIGQRKQVFVISGFIPDKESVQFEHRITGKFRAAVEFEAVQEEEENPILLENNPFSAPVETVLETYSLPAKGEIDPSAIMAIFYYVFFGMMLSDAAYGLIMVIACGFILWKFKDIEIGMKKTMTMFLYCGISTVFWGVMFGGYFGDAVTVISTTFFNHPVTIPPLWFAPVDNPMRLLIFSFAVGILHIFTGLGIKLYQKIKAGDIKGAIFDVVFWYMLVGGGIVYLLSMEMFVNMAQLSFQVPPVVANIAAVIAGLGAVGIIAFGGRFSRNPAKRIAKGLYELYGVTGYLSDILSYSRLLALGLATGVIATVFNKMGSMFGGGIVGFIPFLIVFLIGHALNIGINLLGAYVHTNRLQFVEFFGKFYEGGGEKYRPFSVNTKYYKIKEEK